MDKSEMKAVDLKSLKADAFDLIVLRDRVAAKLDATLKQIVEVEQAKAVVPAATPVGHEGAN